MTDDTTKTRDGIDPVKAAGSSKVGCNGKPCSCKIERNIEGPDLELVPFKGPGSLREMYDKEMPGLNDILADVICKNW